MFCLIDQIVLFLVLQGLLESKLILQYVTLQIYAPRYTKQEVFFQHK